MKSLFEESARTEILNRVESVSPQAAKKWGKMEVSQMLCHCGHALEMAMGTINPKRGFLGRILGPLFKNQYSNETPFGKNSPTSAELVVDNTPNFEQEKNRLKDLVTRFSSGGEDGVTKQPHPFFGPLTPTEWGKGMYKHIDHHLRQFGH